MSGGTDYDGGKSARGRYVGTADVRPAYTRACEYALSVSQATGLAYYVVRSADGSEPPYYAVVTRDLIGNHLVCAEYDPRAGAGDRADVLTHCPHCNATHRGPDDEPGYGIRHCPRCGTRYTIEEALDGEAVDLAAIIAQARRRRGRTT